MKKVYFTIISLLSILTLVGCSGNNTTAELLNNTNDVYGFEAMSSVTLLDSLNTNATNAPLSANPYSYNVVKLATEEGITEAEIDEINKYLGIMEQMFADSDPITVVEQTSDRAEYTNKLVISTKDLNLNTYEYVLYYNETLLNETADEETTDEEANDEEEKDDETESSLEGIMVIGDKEYVVSGKKELEENEMKVEFKSEIDENNWVKVVQKTEENETKFEYNICVDGVISITKMKLEKEESETKLKLELSNGETSSEYEFKVEEEDGEKVIKIEVNDGSTTLEVKVNVIVDPTTGEITYEYKVKDSDHSFKKDRENAHDDDDEEEEEEQDEEL